MKETVRSLSLRFWLPVIAVVIIACSWLLSVLVDVNYQKKTLTEQIRQTLIQEMGYLARELEFHFGHNDSKEAASALASRAVDVNFKFMGIVDKQGIIRLEQQGRGQQQAVNDWVDHFKPGQMKAALQSNQTKTELYSGDNVLTLYVPLIFEHRQANGIRPEPDVVLFATYDLSRQFAQFYQLVLWQSMSWAVGLIGSVIAIIWLVVVWVHRPTNHLIEVVQEIAEGKESIRAKVDGHGEFARLGEAINRLADKLQKRLRDRELARKHEKQQMKILDKIFGAIPDIYFLMDSEGRILDFREPVESDLYQSPDQFMNKKMTEVLPSPAGQLFAEAIEKQKQGEEFTAFEYTLPLDKGNNYFEARLSIADDSGKIVAVIRNITDKKQAEAEIYHKAYYDTLTELPNRFLLLDRLKQALKASRRENNHVAVLFLDLDEFKKINDTLGHEAGDKILIQTAIRLQEVVRDNDTVARQGGDEFIFVLRSIQDPMDIRNVAENIIRSICQPFDVDGRELIVTTSVGIAVFPNDGEQAEELLRKADSAMYHAKAIGKNNYAFYTEGMNKSVARRLAIEEQMAGALNRDEFEIYLQPKILMKNQKLVGGEVLLRWHNEALGMVSPGEFIPIAEQSGQIVDIGYWIFEASINWLAQHQAQLDDNFSLSINVSPRQFRDPYFVESVLLKLKNSAVSAQKIKIEITEGVLLEAGGFIEKALEQLSEAGFLISMDDFGTGYSSMNYLRKFPFHELKIDKCFVDEMCYSDKSSRLVRATIEMSHALGLQVVAEGVETEKQHQLLVDLNCDIGQGYLYARPMPLTRFSEQYLSAGVQRPLV